MGQELSSNSNKKFTSLNKAKFSNNSINYSKRYVLRM